VRIDRKNSGVVLMTFPILLHLAILQYAQDNHERMDMTVAECMFFHMKSIQPHLHKRWEGTRLDPKLGASANDLYEAIKKECK